MSLSATSDKKEKKQIYLDYAASTPLDKEVFVAMLPHLDNNYGNPSSLHKTGRQAFDTLENSRKSIANSLDVLLTEIIFTSSGTESDNLAILGLARANRKHGNHVIISKIEHKAVLESAKILEQEGFLVSHLPVNKYGEVQIKALKELLTDKTILVSVMYANNEIGTIQPIQKISSCLSSHYENSYRPIFHTDACQAVGMLPIKPALLGVDAMTLNSSKIYGPKGAGLLYLKFGTKISPLLVGGNQEFGLRAGTENIASVVGFALAIRKITKNTEKNTARLLDLQKYFLNQLGNHVPELILNGHSIKRLPNNIHICIPDIEGESIILMLDESNISASTGSACSSLTLEPSHVLRAIGLSDDIIHGSVRFTFGIYTTKKELAITARTLGLVVKKLRAMTASSISIKNYSHVKNT